MLIQINAEEVACELAIADTVDFFRGIRSELTSERIKQYLDEKPTDLSVIFQRDIQYYFQKKCDYYFEFLTNKKL